MIDLHHSDCVAWLVDYYQRHLVDPVSYPLFDSCITDPPYHLTSIVKRFGKAGSAPVNNQNTKAGNGVRDAYANLSKGFMGKEWDGGDVAFRPETWRAVYHALKPGAHLVAFSGTRTFHRMVCAIEDAGFEIRDSLFWCYGSGFPKSHDVSKGIDKAAGAERKVVGERRGGAALKIGGDNPRPWHDRQAERGGSYDVTAAATPEAEQWQGWGTALKPALEPICLARKPLSEKSVAANVLKHGTGAISIDACRVGETVETWPKSRSYAAGQMQPGHVGQTISTGDAPAGRWPANLIHDGSEEVLAGFPETSSGHLKAGTIRNSENQVYGKGMAAAGKPATNYDQGGDSGSAARFFYSAKAGPLDRIGTAHATVKPVDLMRWLCRLVTPTGGHILEPFAGSGTTGIAAMAEGFDCTMIELEADHVADIERKLAFLRGEGSHTIAEHNHARRQRVEAQPIGGLFGDSI